MRKRMSEEYLIEYGAPTLAGLKTGNLFSCPVEDRMVFLKELRGFNERLNHKGICLIPLNLEQHRALLYLYRPERLKKDLSAEETRMVLEKKGYPAADPAFCIAELVRRIRRGTAFLMKSGCFSDIRRKMSGASWSWAAEKPNAV